MLPLYYPTTGAVVSSEAPILYSVVQNSTIYNNECQCPLAVEARRMMMSKDSPGLEDNICHHERLFQLGALDMVEPKLNQENKGEEQFLIYETASIISDTHLHVYVFSDIESGRKKEAIATITPENVTCSTCHNGEKQILGDLNNCPHAQIISKVIVSETPVDRIRKMFQKKSDLFMVAPADI
jgi:hypothetical protein